jgi:bifunctional non-homologous end joining protein LigD
MRLLRIPEPFDHPDSVFEPKLDGFRALAHIEEQRCAVVFRNLFKSWPHLCEELAHAARSLLFRREQPYFYAFDLLTLNGDDVRGLPLTQRKRRLMAILPTDATRVLFLDSIAERGRDSISRSVRA